MLSSPTHIPVPSTPALPCPALPSPPGRLYRQGKKAIWSFGASGTWLHILCKVTAVCIHPRVWCVWGTFRPIIHVIGHRQVPSELDVLWMHCSYFSCFFLFSKFVNLTSCMLATWAGPRFPSRNVEPLSSDFFYWASSCKPAPSLPLAAFFFPLPLGAAMFKKGSEQLGELVQLLYHVKQGKVLHSWHICCASLYGGYLSFLFRSA